MKNCQISITLIGAKTSFTYGKNKKDDFLQNKIAFRRKKLWKTKYHRDINC